MTHELVMRIKMVNKNHSAFSTPSWDLDYITAAARWSERDSTHHPSGPPALSPVFVAPVRVHTCHGQAGPIPHAAADYTAGWAPEPTSLAGSVLF